MARYIDADALVREMSLYANRTALGEIAPPHLSYHDMWEIIADAPTAAVAPRAEVAREIFEEIEQEINAALQSNYKVLPQIEQSESLWNRVNGKIDTLRGIDGFIAELKKKYTEEK